MEEQTFYFVASNKDKKKAFKNANVLQKEVISKKYACTELTG